MASQPNLMIRLFWQVHPRIYHWSSGKIGGTLMGLPVLLLTTRGRKSGKPRTKALMYLPYKGNFVVIASNLGQDHHPMWWLNLQADPTAEVEIAGKTTAVRAREAVGRERQDIWRELTRIAPSYDEYEAKTDRSIPVVLLENQAPQLNG